MSPLVTTACDILRVFDARLVDATPPVDTDDATSCLAIDIDLAVEGSVAMAAEHLAGAVARAGISGVAVPPVPAAEVDYFTARSPKGWLVRVVRRPDGIVTAAVWYNQRQREAGA